MTAETPLFPELETRDAPLAHRMRPKRLDEFLGQRDIVGAGKPLRQAIERGLIGSIVFWGPPGSGKTTLAKLIAEHTDKHFETFSAVTEGVPRVREIIREARQREQSEGRGTILFCDEIHRFNKAQQDAFLPHVEDGAITLIGATTENPSFELNRALLSRVRVFVLEPLAIGDLVTIVGNGVDLLREDSQGTLTLADDAIELIAEHADGDARRALNALEAIWHHFTHRGESTATREMVAAALEERLAQFDKSGEEHFNQISALHKSIRGSDVEGALYWLARMLAGGEDPMYLLRRLVRMASEDIGLSDPRALTITLAARDAFHFLGSPEGELAIAEAAVYLASAPKSNRIYKAWGQAQTAAANHPAAPVPLHIRNAPTSLMRDLGYGKEYRYDHDEGGYAAGQEYLPDDLIGSKWYEPTDIGFEKTIAERIEWWEKIKQAAKDD